MARGGKFGVRRRLKRGARKTLAHGHLPPRLAFRFQSPKAPLGPARGDRRRHRPPGGCVVDVGSVILDEHRREDRSRRTGGQRRTPGPKPRPRPFPKRRTPPRAARFPCHPPQPPPPHQSEPPPPPEPAPPP